MNEAVEIMDKILIADTKIQQLTQRENRKAEIKNKLFELNRKICGNCDHSMKTTCPFHGKCGGNSGITSTPENWKSACDSFTYSEWRKNFIKKLREESSRIYQYQREALK